MMRRIFYANNDNFGNALSLAVLCTGNPAFYANDFKLVEGFMEVTLPAGPYPLTVFGDYVVNTKADDWAFDMTKGDTGWAAGLMLGKCVAPQSWALRYEYRDTERDAVVGALNDSDFGGGGTNSRGHVICAEYMALKNVRLALRYFINDAVGRMGFVCCRSGAPVRT